MTRDTSPVPGQAAACANCSIFADHAPAPKLLIGFVMMNKLLAAVAALLFTACLDNDPSVDTNDERTTVEIKADEADTTFRDEPPTPALCEQIVETEGPCAVACDPVALAAFIPKGTCTLFLCTLEDGSQYKTGGCSR
jgi:hypothetical protein